MRLFLAAAVAISIAGPVMADDLPETSFNVVGSIGTLTMYTKAERGFWTDTIPEKSGGRIKVDVKPFTELGFKGGEIFRLVANGTLPVATTVLSYNSGEVPRNEAADLAGVVGTVEELHKVVDTNRASFSDFLEKEHGVKLLGFGTYHAQLLYCRDKFDSLKDLAGRKVRTSSASQQALVEYLGGSAISLAFGEVQPALASGVVDCAITGALSGYSAKWYETAKYLSPLPISFGLAATMANLSWWNGLDPVVQTFLSSNVRDLETTIFNLAATETDEGIACNTDGRCQDGANGGMTLVEVTDEDRALLSRALTESILPSFAERCGADCVTWWNSTIGASVGQTIQ